MQPLLGDAFGELLLAQQRDLGRAQQEIIERDDGFISASDARTYFSTEDTWHPLDRLVCDQARGRVLDIGCGAGRHSLALRERGLEVTGLEPFPGAAQVCRDRGVTVIDSAVEDLTVGGWDSFVLLGNNLALLGSPLTAVSTLRHLADHAAPGAVLLGLGTQPYATTDPLHLAYHERNRAAGRPGGQLRIRVRHRELATDWFDYWFMTVDEVTRAVDQTPWRLADVTASGTAYLVHLELGR